MPGPTRRSWKRWIGVAPTERMGGLTGPSVGRLGYRPGGLAAPPDHEPPPRWSLLHGREGAPKERRWTGIEPARRGSPVSAALKAAGPTRRPDTSTSTLGTSTLGGDDIGPDGGGPRQDGGLSPSGLRAVGSPVMKKLLLLAILVALGVVAAKKVRASN